eukprot:TRINITY_DN8869_c0_g1_i1.p1 TRINITY_DN8869_c0_g1~~TRINITY_DN8869_c0_g1_i1.p1  ORF type:complete len:167 (-),score=5.27 TRINITY_DN8869_c0_g1_i1:138-638(-)
MSRLQKLWSSVKYALSAGRQGTYPNAHKYRFPAPGSALKPDESEVIAEFKPSAEIAHNRYYDRASRKFDEPIILSGATGSTEIKGSVPDVIIDAPYLENMTKTKQADEAFISSMVREISSQSWKLDTKATPPLPVGSIHRRAIKKTATWEYWDPEAEAARKAEAGK